MNIEDLLTRQHFVLNPTTKWIAIQDPRPSFRKAFGTVRFGKLQRNGLYVTLGPLKASCERLIGASGLTVQHIRSTSSKGDFYPGFDVQGVPEAILEKLVGALRAAVDQYLETLG